MADDSDGFDLRESITEGARRIATYTDLFGVQREQYICEHCDQACHPTTTYNPNTAAFDGGASPCWSCPSCGRAYVRDADDSAVGMDLYGRDPPE
jgi:uncharacterized protein with PIN domain